MTFGVTRAAAQPFIPVSTTPDARPISQPVRAVPRHRIADKVKRTVIGAAAATVSVVSVAAPLIAEQVLLNLAAERVADHLGGGRPRPSAGPGSRPSFRRQAASAERPPGYNPVRASNRTRAELPSLDAALASVRSHQLSGGGDRLHAAHRDLRDVLGHDGSRLTGAARTHADAYLAAAHAGDEAALPRLAQKLFVAVKSGAAAVR